VDEHGLRLAPVIAGTEPVGGLSGAAVFDASARVIGIQTAVSSRKRDNAIMLGFQPVEALRELQRYITAG